QGTSQVESDAGAGSEALPRGYLRGLFGDSAMAQIPGADVILGGLTVNPGVYLCRGDAEPDAGQSEDVGERLEPIEFLDQHWQAAIPVGVSVRIPLFEIQRRAFIFTFDWTADDRD